MRFIFLLFFALNLFASDYKALHPISYDENLANLGKKLYFDINLSPKKISCNTCHDLNLTGSGTNNIGHFSGDEINPPTVLNAAYTNLFFKNGDVTNLREQVQRSLMKTMGLDYENTKQIIENNVVYKKMFKEAGLKPEFDSLVSIFEEFEKSLVTLDSAFDLYLNGDKTAISQKAKIGFELFKKYGCANCHIGDTLGGNIIASVDSHFSPVCNLDNAEVRVPSLRNISITGPYGYSGKFSNLEDIVFIMITCQLGINAPQDDIENIVEFLKTLTGKRPKIMDKNNG